MSREDSRAALLEKPTIAGLAKRAWLEDGIAVIAVDQLNDDWERQQITNVANRQYGKREAGR